MYCGMCMCVCVVYRVCMGYMWVYMYVVVWCLGVGVLCLSSEDLKLIEHNIYGSGSMFM